jgi:uncharacterized repeat protein (TIGR03803 family)
MREPHAILVATIGALKDNSNGISGAKSDLVGAGNINHQGQKTGLDSMTTRLCWLTIGLLCLVGNQTFAASSLGTLHSFGFLEYSTANPQGELIESTNGMLYGTSPRGGIGKGTVFQMNKDGTGFRVIKVFGATTNDGEWPIAALIEASDGMLYGTTSEGGDSDYGTIFRVDKAVTNFTVIKTFSGSDGAYPEARLLEASDHLLYGSASGGGTNDNGVLFRISKDGSGFELLQTFSGTNGANPEANLFEASDGMLYGTTYSGGASNLGTVFRLNKDGSNFTVLLSFISHLQTNGFGPLGGLVEGTNGRLYGTTSAGLSNSFGTIFSLNKDGSAYSVLYSFARTNGQSPLAGLIVGTDGLLYGTTFDGGSSNNGTVFRIQQDGSNYTVLTSLTNLVSDPSPAAALLESSEGDLFGTTQLGHGAVFRLSKNGSNFTVVRRFNPAGGDGASSYAALTRASDGQLYGTTRIGGDDDGGSIFSILPTGQSYTKVWDFVGTTNGTSPVAPVLERTNGLLYGTAESGGSANEGTIFAVAKTGVVFSVLHDFSGGPDGEFPRGSLIEAGGLLYGTTMMGGSANRGTLFSLDPDGTMFTTLRSFVGSSGDGSNPMEQLTLGSDQQIYGTTYFSTSGLSAGSIFTLNQNIGYAVLKNFTGLTNDAANPRSPLLEASDGMLYGTTYAGGGVNNAGTVFRISTNGTAFQILRFFTGVSGDGRHPSGQLVEGSDGTIYGTTERGGANDFGSLFKLNKDGTDYAILASFNADTGRYPKGGLALGPYDVLYGTTDQGGSMDFGTIFRYGPPLEGILEIQIVSGHPTLTCAGLPGNSYSIERAPSLISPISWLTLLSTNAPANGRFEFSDQNSPAAGAFYRLTR